MNKVILTCVVALFAGAGNASSAELSEAQIVANLNLQSGGGKSYEYNGEKMLASPLRDDEVLYKLHAAGLKNHDDYLAQGIPKLDFRHRESPRTLQIAKLIMNNDAKKAIDYYSKYLDDFNRESRSIPDENKSERDYYLSLGYQGRAWAELTADRLDDASRDYGEAIKLRPRNPRNYANRAVIYVTQHKKELESADREKVKSLPPITANEKEDLLKEFPGDGKVADVPVDFWKKWSDKELAEKMKLKPNERLFRNRGKLVEVCPYKDVHFVSLKPNRPIGKSLDNVPEADNRRTESSRLAKSAYDTFRKGDYKQSIQDCTRFIDAYNKESKSFSDERPDWRNYFLACGYEKRAECYLKLNDLKQSVADLREAIKLRPRCTKDYVARASAYRQLGLMKLADQDDAQVRSLPKSEDWQSDLQAEFSVAKYAGKN